MYVENNLFETFQKQLFRKIDEIGKDLKSLVNTQSVFEKDGKPLDNQDLCLILHVSSRTLQRYRSEGLLPFFKIGQKIYYRASDVQDFVYRNGFDHWDKKRIDDAIKAKKE